MTESAEVLPDLLRPKLDLVVCGTAVGERSAAQKTYYAYPGNKFWSILADTGLTPYRLAPKEYKKLLVYGIGLTDLAKRRSGSDEGLRAADFDVAGFRQKIERVRPRILAFNGKKAASIYFEVRTTKIAYGRQLDGIGSTVVFVLTSTSGGNAHWRPEPWRECARFVRSIRHQREPRGSSIERINEYLQSRLLNLACVRVSAVEAAKWLDEASLLQDSSNRPGRPLRRLLRANRIVGQEQRPNQKNGRWWINRL